MNEELTEHQEVLVLAEVVRTREIQPPQFQEDEEDMFTL